MFRKMSVLLTLLTIGLTGFSAFAAESQNPLLGRWMLITPGGGAGWLNVHTDQGFLDAEILWIGGSVVPVDSVIIMEHNGQQNLVVGRLSRREYRDDQRKVIRTHVQQNTIFCRLAEGDNDTLICNLLTVEPVKGQLFSRINSQEFSGKRAPEIPPKPDLSQVKFGEPIVLFDGNNMDKWELVDPDSVNGWAVWDGFLVNNPVQTPGKHINYGNLRTKEEFEDFNLTLEVNVPKNGNSGVYLRGIYEVTGGGHLWQRAGQPQHGWNLQPDYSQQSCREAGWRVAETGYNSG